MELIKKYWYVTLLLLGTAGLGLITLLISLQLQQRSSITTQESQAATPGCSLTFTIEGPTPTDGSTICQLAFNINIPTKTPTPSQMQPSKTPTPRPTNTIGSSPTLTNTPGPTNTIGSSPTLTNTPPPTNTPIPGSCSATCISNADCANALICSNGLCRNPDCVEQPNCACYFVPTPKVPVTGTGTTLIGIAVIAGGIILLLLGLVF